LFNAQELYAHAVKRAWKKVRGMPWKAVTVDVELDLPEKGEKNPRWQSVRLLFVRGIKEPGEAGISKKDWALFLTTDIKLSMSKMLEVYALRWGIEVYFKEAKQHLGFLQEQTATFASHTASIHLCAIRYLMLVHN
jgi:IS4 transposase